jgi:hypothetical protein
MSENLFLPHKRVGPPVLPPPNDFRRVHSCPEKSESNDVRIGSRLNSKCSTTREKYEGGAGFIKRDGRMDITFVNSAAFELRLPREGQK